MNTFIQKLHEQALTAAKQFKQAEATLIDILMKLDEAKGFRQIGSPSLFDYATKKLGLSESVAFNLITVARKSVEVPALKQEITLGNLTVTQARRIAPVLTPQNQNEWIEKAKALPQRALEKEVARICPREATPEKATYVTESRLSLSVGVSEDLMKKLKRIQDLESQRTKKAARIESALEAMAEAYLEKNDPVRKAQRAQVRIKKEPPTQSVHKPDSSQVSQKREPIRADLQHHLNLRDQNQCTATDEKGNRCAQTRWLEKHHVQPVNQGGKNTLENLRTLCSAHHKMEHH